MPSAKNRPTRLVVDAALRRIVKSRHDGHKIANISPALTAETIFEIMKCISDVDMPARGRMGSKCEIFRFFSILATPTIETFRFLDVGHPE